MNNWSLESRELAAKLLPSALRYLHNYIEIYTTVVKENFKFTCEVSDIFVQIGRCSVFAEIADDKKTIELIDKISDTAHSLLQPIMFEEAFNKLKELLPSFDMMIDSMYYEVNKPDISVGNYREK